MDVTPAQTEGALIQRVGRDWSVSAGDGDTREHLVQDTGSRLQGRLQARCGTDTPHPVVVRAAGGRWTPWHEAELGCGTHGDLVVMCTGGGAGHLSVRGGRTVRATLLRSPGPRPLEPVSPVTAAV